MSQPLSVSVIIPTHNPRMDYLARVIEALAEQTLPLDQWELLIVDNSSQENVEGRVNIGWHLHARVVREEILGLTFARLRGFAEAKGEVIVMVDDDNILDPNYLEISLRMAKERPALGAFGGRSVAEYEVKPPEWLQGRERGLGVRNLGDSEICFPSEGEWRELKMIDGGWRVKEFPDCAPIGAGMVLRREAAEQYTRQIQVRGSGKVEASRSGAVVTDRQGDSLSSGGDNDICLTVLEHGWQVGYFPKLSLTHLIPKKRLTLEYHRRMARDSMKSFIIMLNQHGIRPWSSISRWTLHLRIAGDWMRTKPWKGPQELLRWFGHIGMYEGRATLAAERKFPVVERE